MYITNSSFEFSPSLLNPKLQLLTTTAVEALAHNFYRTPIVKNGSMLCMFSRLATNYSIPTRFVIKPKKLMEAPSPRASINQHKN